MIASPIEYTPTLTIDLNALKLTPEQFQEICAANGDLRLELTATGELIVMPPTGWRTSSRNSKLTTQICIWNEQTELGEAFDSSGGFVLPNKAQRSPDVAWVEKSRIEAANPDPNRFLPLAPDFAIELRSATDRLSPLQEKMQEYQANGVRLGWLIDPQNQRVEIYRVNGDPEVLQSPTRLSGEDVLPGFTLDLTKIW
jgi:Uma2 family endonuclease